MVVIQIGDNELTLGPGGGVYFGFQRAGVGIQAYHVTIAQLGQRAAVERFRAHMDGGGHFARCARHAAIGDEGNFEATVLEYAQEGGEFVQFGHAVGFGALEANHHNDVAVQVARLKRRFHFVLILEDLHRRFYDAVLLGNGRDFDDATAQVAFHHGQAAGGSEGCRDRAQHFFVQAVFRAFAPDHFAIFQEGLLGVSGQVGAKHGGNIAVEQARA